MTLKDGKTGMTLKIQSIADSELKERLMAMGLTPGTQVTVLRSAPSEIRLLSAYDPITWHFAGLMRPVLR